MIVAHHYSFHAGFELTSYVDLKIFYVQCLQMFGKLGVNLFVLISGYFLSTSKIKIEKIIKLELQVIFYSVLIGLLFYFFKPESTTLKSLAKDFMPLLFGRYWFYSTYFVLYLFSPFINNFVHSAQKQDLKKLIVLMFVLWVLIPVIPKIPGLEINDLGWFIFLYICASYYRLYPDDFNKTKKIYLLFGVLCVFLIILSVLAFDFLGNFDKRFVSHFNYFLPENSLLIVFASLFLFIGFGKVEMRQNKIINLISSTTFGVYLIHDNWLVRPFLWKTLFKNALFISSNYIFLHSLLVIFGVFAVCSLCDLIRQFVFEKIIMKLLMTPSQ
ncbi:MAG: acyltransferase family protein [Clostridia bacterium]|nr:acyltransferase family protein [Clostridia bacterium]